MPNLLLHKLFIFQNKVGCNKRLLIILLFVKKNLNFVLVLKENEQTEKTCLNVKLKFFNTIR